MSTNNRLFFGKFALAALLSASGIFTGLNASAATWKGDAGATGTLFNIASNWDTLPGAGAALAFGANAAGSDELYNDLTGASFGAITFNAGAPAYTIRGNAFTWNNNSTLANNSGVWQTIAANILMPAGATTYNFTGNGPVALTGGIRNTAAGNLTINNNLAAGGTLAISAVDLSAGAGQLYLYTGYAGNVIKVGDIDASKATGYGLYLGNNTLNTQQAEIWLTGANTFANGVKGSFRISTLYLDYQSSNSSKISLGNDTGGAGIDWSGGVVHLLGGSTRENIGFLNLSTGAGLGTLRIDRAGTNGTSAIMVTGSSYNSIYSNAGAGGMIDLGDDGVLGSLHGNNNNVNGIISSWITVGNNNAAGRDWAFRDTDFLFYAYTGYGALGAGNTVNALVTGGTSISADTTVNSLKMDAAGRLDLGGKKLTVTGGGLLYTGAGDYTIGGAGAPDGAIVTANSTGLALWQSGNGVLTINADLSAPELRLTGGGEVVFNGTFAGNGHSFISVSKVTLGADQALGRGSLYVQEGAVLDLNGHDLKVAGIRGGNVNVAAGAGTITNSDAARLATITVGALDGPAATGIDGLSATNLTGNIHLIISGNLTQAQKAARPLAITGGVEFKDNLATTNAKTIQASYNSFSIISTNFLTAGAGDLSFTGNGAFKLEDNGGFELKNNLNVTGTNNFMSMGADYKLSGTMTGGAGAEMIFGVTDRDGNGRVTTFNGNMSNYKGKLYMSVQGQPVGSFALTQNANDIGGEVVLAAYGDATFRTVTLQATEAGTYRLGGLSSLNITTGGADLNATGAAILRNTSGGNVIFEVGGANLSGTFAGHLTNNGSITGGTLADTSAAGKTTALTKVGTGTLALTNQNTYSGDTTVSGGVLLLSGNADLKNTSAVTVSGGTLAVSDNAVISSNARVGVDSGVLLVNNSAFATAGKKLDIGAGGVLGGSGVIGTGEIEFKTASAGVTGGGLGEVGELTFSGDQLWLDFTYYFDILNDSVHDLLSFGGTGLDLSYGSGYTLSVNNLGGLDFSDVTIISGLDLSHFGDPDDVLGQWSLPSDEYTLSLDGNNLLLSYAAVPEPSTWLLLSLGATLLVALRRRRGFLLLIKSTGS